jgi:hypothetical protein
MDEKTRCTKCGKRKVAAPDKQGRTYLECLKCDYVDSLRTNALKWAASSLYPPN